MTKSRSEIGFRLEMCEIGLGECFSQLDLSFATPATKDDRIAILIL